MRTFRFKGITGSIDQFNFVQWGGMGFHLEDITGPLADHIKKVISK